jgi:hypothetical protein
VCANASGPINPTNGCHRLQSQVAARCATALCCVLPSAPHLLPLSPAGGTAPGPAQQLTAGGGQALRLCRLQRGRGQGPGVMTGEVQTPP